MRFNFELDPGKKCLIETSFTDGAIAATVWHGAADNSLEYRPNCDFPDELKRASNDDRDELLARLVIANFKTIKDFPHDGYEVVAKLSMPGWQGDLAAIG